jgi:F0F1-type ATP synthase membrane subunit b/b'
MPPKAGAGKVGRPRKPDTEGTKEEVQKRLYMREYNARLAKDIQQLDKMEQECEEELKEIKQQKRDLEKEYKKSIKMLEQANKQAGDILKEAVKPVKKP